MQNRCGAQGICSYEIYNSTQLTSAPATSATTGWPRLDLTSSYTAFESPHVIWITCNKRTTKRRRVKSAKKFRADRCIRNRKFALVWDDGEYVETREWISLACRIQKPRNGPACDIQSSLIYRKEDGFDSILRSSISLDLLGAVPSTRHEKQGRWDWKTSQQYWYKLCFGMFGMRWAACRYD